MSRLEQAFGIVFCLAIVAVIMYGMAHLKVGP